MQHLIESARKAASDKNYYAALMVTLTLPDIAAALSDTPRGDNKFGKTSGAKYKSWCDQNLDIFGPAALEGYPFTSSDLYALRCALLHQGLSDTTDHGQSPDRVGLWVLYEGDNAPKSAMGVSLASADVEIKPTGRQAHISAQSLIDIVCNGVEKWLDGNNAPQQSRLDQMFRLSDSSQNAPGSIVIDVLQAHGERLPQSE